MNNTTWEDSVYYKLKKNPKKLSLDNKTILLQKESWNLSELISEPNTQKEVEQKLSEYYNQTDNAVGTEIFLPPDASLETALVEKNNKALIVVERTALLKPDYDYIYKNFNRKKIHIIIVTRKAPDAIPDTVHLERLSSECLFEIFKSHLSNNPDFFAKEEFDLLLQIIDSNTLVVALLGKVLNKYLSKSNSPKDIEAIKDKLLDSKKWIWKDATLPNTNIKSYDKKTSTNKVIYYIRLIISKFQMKTNYNLQN